jgi:hypothetical protein
MITLKIKPRANVRSSYDPTTLTSFHQGNRPTLNCFYALHFNLGTRFSLKGGAVTPRVTKTLIKVINK